MAIIDILKLQSDPEFTVDLSVNSVAITNTVSTPWDFINFDGRKFFQPNDNLRLLSMWLRLPICFTLYDQPCQGQLIWHLLGDVLNVTEIDGETGKFYIPEPDQELGLDIFCNFLPYTPGVSAAIALGAFATEISMIQVPAILDEEVLEWQMYLKVLHTLPLGA